MIINTIGVVGEGAMGTGIAHIAAMAGYNVILRVTTNTSSKLPLLQAALRGYAACIFKSCSDNAPGGNQS